MTKKAPSVFVCMPTYDTMQVSTCLSLLKLMDKFTQAQIKSTVSTFKCPYVGYGRNILSALFMESGFDYQLFVDADVEFDPKDVGRMILAEKDMACVPYRKKTHDNTIKFSVAFENFNNISIDKFGMTEIIGGPAGLTLVKRNVYESLMQKHPDLKINSADGISKEAKKYMYNFWENTFDSKQGNWFGEDVSFCNLARNAGHKFYAVVDGVTTHHGNYGYKGSLIDTFKKADEKDN